MRSSLTFVLAIIATTVCVGSPAASNGLVPEQKEPGLRVVTASELQWEQLNPARGDNSPKATTLWGDRKSAGPAGFLVDFVDGFASPAHIHNVSYRGVVISGLIHNDDPDAAAMWMPAGSFWTQPKGEAHVTAARGAANRAYIEIEDGPYLVLPVHKAFDSGEKPINVDVSNLVWLDASTISGADQTASTPSETSAMVALLWGSLQGASLRGAFIQLPPGFVGEIRSHASSFRAVVITGQLQYQPGEAGDRTLQPGSYFSSEGESVHQVSSSAGAGSIIYVRADGRFGVIPARLDK